MKNKLRWLAVPLLAISMLVAPTVPANALEITDRKVTVMKHGTYFKCYHNYNFFEKYLLGKEDGWRFTLDEC